DVAMQVLIDAFRTANNRLQSILAKGLASNSASAQHLLDAIAQGKAPARLLFEQTIRDSLAGAKVPDLDARIKELTKGLTPPAEALQKLIDDRRAAFASAHPVPERGQKIFATNCMACHSIDGQGKTVGPQLDGIGN